jgi:hypothetical protein
MSRLFIFRSAYVIFAIGLLFPIFGAEKAYSQCNVLCMHERGDVSAVKGGLILDPSYEVAPR